MQRVVADEYGVELQRIDPTAFIERYAAALDVSSETTEKANAILERTESTIQNCASRTKAAASLYLAEQYTETNVQLTEVAAEADVSGQTISRRAREQKAVLSDDFLWGRDEGDDSPE
ncbi:transcription initiation factor IIB family protein [Halorussus salinisoli]|uniref:hypothetical protein n=1 Tax=Halorussus salinisoli TaxID=2558242 RepID=UPI0014857B06|nr:hypothetical protein [Halorussus salinisoli]